MLINRLFVKFSGAWGHKGPHSRLASHSSNSTRSKLQLCSLPKLCGPKSWKLMSLAKRLWCAEQRLQPIPGLMTSTQIKVALLDCKSSLEVLPVDQHFGLCSDCHIHDCTYFRIFQAPSFKDQRNALSATSSEVCSRTVTTAEETNGAKSSVGIAYPTCRSPSAEMSCPHQQKQNH